VLQKAFQPRVVEHLAALAAHAREDDALLNRLAEERLKNKLEIVAEGARMRIDDLLANELFRDEDAFTALSSRLIRRIIRKHKSMHTSAGAGELTAMHVGQVLELARRGNNGATLQLPGGIEVRRHADALVFCAATKKKATALREEHQYEHEIDFLLGSTLLQVPELGCAFRFTVIDWLAKRAETSVSGDVLNRDALRFPLTLRNWRHGDRFRAVGHSKPQKLKRLFNKQGVDRWRRGGWPVIVSDGILAWARGFGASAEFAVDDGTHTGIVIAEEKSA
jgi:tRNA(Ile)-lysidine synthase